MKKLLTISALLGAFAIVLATAAGKDESHEKHAPRLCECSCAKCPPKTILSVNKSKEHRYRTCYRDANNNRKCDNSVQEGKQCKNDCEAVDTATDGKKKKVPRPPCAGCPCPGNCAQCGAAK